MVPIYYCNLTANLHKLSKKSLKGVKAQYFI